MEITLNTLRSIFEEIDKYVSNHKKIVIEIDATQKIEVGKCIISKDLDINNIYDNSYYIYYNNQYIMIETNIAEIQSYINHKINELKKEKININIEEDNKYEIGICEIENYTIGNILRNIGNLPKEYKKEISIEELTKYIYSVDYITYSYPFNFRINEDEYEVGICSIDEEIDKIGIYTEHLYIEKNDKIIFLQDPDFVNKIDIEKVFKGIKDKVELQIRPHFMSGKQCYIPKNLLSKDIIKQIKESY